MTIRNVNRGTTTTFTTDGSGAFTAPFLVPGTYAVEVEMQGFEKWVRSDIVLEVNQRARVDAQLQVGTLEETTIVVATAPLLRSETSEVGAAMEEKAIRELPLNSRNLFNHPGFGFPNAAIGSATVGRITTTVVDNRSMQFAVKFDF